jgi:hypothetical protein
VAWYRVSRRRGCRVRRVEWLLAKPPRRIERRVVRTRAAFRRAVV